jgi:hypothetical protein
MKMGMEVATIDSLQVMAKAVAASRLWKTVDTPEKALALMLLCQSEGLHPMTAVRRYDLIQGTPTMKSEAQLAEFYARGGAVVWMQRTAEVCEAKFIHPKNCPDGVVIKWTMDDARRAGLTGKDNWKHYPRQMLAARVQAEGVQAVDPGAGLGMLTPEEAMDVRSHIADQAAALASTLTGEPVQDMPAMPEIPQREDKEWKKLRAELNKTLQACQRTKEFEEACKAFQKEHTKGIWVTLTRHNDVETFAMLAQEHKARLESEEHFISPEGMKEWREKLAKCSEKEFAQFEKTMLAYPEYRDNQECADAIAQRGRELGREEYLID